MATIQSKKEESQEVGVYQLKNGLWAYRFIVKINGEQKTQRRSKDEEGKPFKTQKQAARARKKAEDIAEDLLKLYAAREAQKDLHF